MRKRTLWLTAALSSLLAIGAAWARQDAPPPILADEPLEAPSLPEEAAAPVDPVDQVSQLTEQIRNRRSEDSAAVQALVEQLTAQADTQRAALARTEEALQQARSLLGAFNGEPSLTTEPIAAPADRPFDNDPPSSAPSPFDEPRAELPPPSAELARFPMPTTASMPPPVEAAASPVPVHEEPPLAPEPNSRIRELERQIQQLIDRVEQIRRDG